MLYFNRLLRNCYGHLAECWQNPGQTFRWLAKLRHLAATRLKTAPPERSIAGYVQHVFVAKSYPAELAALFPRRD